MKHNHTDKQYGHERSSCASRPNRPKPRSRSVSLRQREKSAYGPRSFVVSLATNALTRLTTTLAAMMVSQPVMLI